MALSKLAVRRLTKLADYMDSLPASANKHFSMRTFFDHKGKHDHEYGGSPADLTLCGTVACAAGWATAMPFFRKLGLRLDPGGITGLSLGGTFTGINEPDFIGLFGLETFKQSKALFGPKVRVKTPKQWAKHCRKFIRENSK